MSKDNQELGFFNYAHSYCKSVFLLTEHKNKGTHIDQVVRHLFYQAMELYLKSFLLSQSVTENELKSKYGHKLNDLFGAAFEKGLAVPVYLERDFQHMQDTDNVISSRYIRYGNHRVLSHEHLYEICFTLHQAVIEYAYSSVQSRRKPFLAKPKSWSPQ